MVAKLNAPKPGVAPRPVDNRIPVRDNVLVHEVAATDETVLFARDRGELLLLNDTGAGVYYLIDGRRTVADITEVVHESFPDAEGVGADVAAFLTHLESLGAVRFA